MCLVIGPSCPSIKVLRHDFIIANCVRSYHILTNIANLQFWIVAFDADPLHEALTTGLGTHLATFLLTLVQTTIRFEMTMLTINRPYNYDMIRPSSIQMLNIDAQSSAISVGRYFHT